MNASSTTITERERRLGVALYLLRDLGINPDSVRSGVGRALDARDPSGGTAKILDVVLTVALQGTQAAREVAQSPDGSDVGYRLRQGLCHGLLDVRWDGEVARRDPRLTGEALYARGIRDATMGFDMLGMVAGPSPDIGDMMAGDLSEAERQDLEASPNLIEVIVALEGDGGVREVYQRDRRTGEWREAGLEADTAPRP